MAFSPATKFKMQTLHYKKILVVFGSLLLLESVQKAFCTTYTINTNNPPTISDTNSILIHGKIQNKTFKGPNGESWDHEVAVFNIPESNKTIFDDNTVVVAGNNSLSISTTGDLLIKTSLDVSGQEVKDDDTSVFLRGGFVRKSNSCCVLGAGPGAAYSYHGGGHGGRGGGYYQDFNTSRYYSWDYHDVNYLLGGSTSTVLFESKAGSGGGAIEIIAENGTLEIDAPISANGFSSKNTSEEHCAGGSSGGLIRLKANTVVFTKNGHLFAKGGNSGFSTSKLKHYCGDGGGGGVIQVFSTFDNNTLKQLHVHGGKGIDNGEAGVVFQGVFFNDGKLNINTSDCSMKWLSILVHQGILDHRTYRTPNNQMKITYTVCSFTFKSSLHIGSGAHVVIFGTNALKIASERGNIELMTMFDLNGTGKPGPRSLGAFVMKNLNEMNVGPGNVTRCNAINLFANDFETLVGGSVCTENAVANTPVNAEGGGAIELVAKAGTIVIGNGIKVDGYSDNDKAGATGGLIRLIGKKVHLKDSAFFSARSSPKGSNLASGGIVQIKSDMDIEGLCEKKFHVTGVRDGLVNVMVSASESYQVQFIQEGNLLINTTLCIWVHRTVSNYSMAYSQFGSIYNDTSNDINTCLFNFKPPIILNGSANVTLTGDHALSISSKQGIYIGVELVIDSGMVAGKSRYLGGYCVKEPSLAKTGTGPGRGRPNTNAGGGHGGRGGLFFEDNNGKTYGYTYGIKPFLLTGGSTGTSTQGIAGIQGCGGGAIRISSNRNLTINAAIRANGYSATLFNSHPHGGSSGGTIYLGARQVILEDSALLEAKGSDVAAPVAASTGGGGGGVIVINSTNPFIGKKPVPAENTRGGHGLVPGESGVVIINDVVYREPSNPVDEVPSNFSGCYLISAVNLPPKKKMLAHEARPKTCLLECRANDTLFAVIRNESCYCLNENASFVVKNTSLCKQPCPATFNYSCGGETNDIYSVYTTGVALPVTTTPPPPPPTTTEPISTTMFVPTTRPFDKASTGFTELNQRNITKDNAQKVVQELVNLTQTTEMNGGDTLAAVDIINKLATGNVLSPKNRNETEQAGQAIVETASRLLGSENEESWKYIETKNTTNQKTSSHNVLEAIEKIAVDLGSGLEKDENVTIETDHVAMGIIKKNMVNFTGDSYPHYDQLSEKWQLGDRLYIPPETAEAFKTPGGSETTVFFVLYNRINNALKSNLKEGTIINSRVISVGFDRDLVNPLPKPVVISFTKYQMDNYTSPVCSFLDFSNKTSGDWSNHGVKMTSFEGNKIECESNHLTNFAVLMQVKEFKISKPHAQALQMITYIGCGISLFGLALTLATFLSLETLASERTSIHKNLVVAIGLAQIIFLAGIDVVYNPIACKIVALCLHYLYTAAFTWMCCEGLHLYTKVIEVFSSEASKMKYYYMLGWGVPLIIVIISAASRIDGYSTETACWISIDHGLIWAFVGPVLVIMCINFVVMVMVIKVILASVTSIQNPGNTSQVKAGLKGMVVLLPLLGLTWVFGLMAVNEKTIAFQYIFAILNSLQGLFIFAFHCIGNSEVRVAYKRLHEKRTLAKSLPEHSLSSGNHHKNVEEFNKRRMNSRETNSTGDEDIIVTKAIRSVSDVKLTAGTDHVAMQTFGDADSGRWSLNCPSPDPPCIIFQSATKDPRGNPRSAPDILDGPKATPRESYRSDGNYPTDRHRCRGGNQGNRREESSSTNKYQRF